MRQKLCVFPCLSECACAGFSVYLNTREVAFPSRAATMACLPMLLFVSIFTFAYAVRCLSYARGFLSQRSLSSSHSHAFHSRTHACTHTHTQSTDSQLMNTVLPQQLWETHSSSLYLGDGWRGGQKRLWRDASEGSLLGSDNDSPHTYFYFILFIR